jgi:hypothetical protein
MPSRKAEFHCVCKSCAATGGVDTIRQPLGCIIPLSQKHAHLARIKAERDAVEHQAVHAQDTDIPHTVFALTLADEGPEIETQPNRLWSSHLDDQESASIQLDLSDAALIADSIVRGMSRLPIVTSQPGHPVLEPYIFLVFAPIPSSNSYEQCLTKREKNRRTVKSHKILTNLEIRSTACFEKLSATSSNNLDHKVLKCTDMELSILRSSLDKVTQCTESLDQRKQAIGEKLNQVEACLLEVWSCLPTLSHEPLCYNSGKLFWCFY